MRPSRSHVGAVAFVTIAMGAVGFVPLFGGPGYEQSLATGLLAPSAAAIGQALDGSRDPTQTPLASVGRGALLGVAVAAASLCTAALHGVRVGVCEWQGALVYFALTAAVGSVLGGVWGAWVGELVRASGAKRRRTLAAVGALAAPVVCAGLGVWRFWSSPMIFAYDPFVGYFSGTLYDTVIEPGIALYTYRVGSLATLTAATLAASVASRAPSGIRFDLTGAAPRARAALAALAALASLAVTARGAELGHWSTAESIAKELGAKKSGARCDVLYPSTTRELDADLLVKDCDEELAAVEKTLGARGPERLRAYFFRDADEKKRLMGAAHTYIAKPWRGEVYLQLAGYPHPVLGHEIAHVVAGSFGRGPFRVAGELGGLVPNPGLIEGIAVAASPDAEVLTDLEWSRAMLDLGILPAPERLFSLGFLGDASDKSYTVAGAFITWLMSLHGAEPVRRWYGGAPVEAVFGKDLRTLGADFRAHVASLPLHPNAAAIAKARFGRRGIFGRKCPHVVDALRRDADVCRDTQRWDEALGLYSRAIALDPADFASKHRRASVDLRHRDREKGRSELCAMAADERVPQTWRDRADEAVADADLVVGELTRAAERYDALIARTVDEDVARTLEVKALAARDPDALAAVLALLLGKGELGPDIFVAGVELGEWGQRTRSALAAYLVGKNLVQRGHFSAGRAALERSLGAPEVTARITRESARMLAIAACATGDADAIARVGALTRARESSFAGAGGRRDALSRLLERCSRR